MGGKSLGSENLHTANKVKQGLSGGQGPNAKAALEVVLLTDKSIDAVEVFGAEPSF